VQATLDATETGGDGDLDFVTRLEKAAEILRNPVSAGIASVELENLVHSATFRMEDGGWIFLDDQALSPDAFGNASHAYQTLREFGGYGEARADSAVGRPVFSGSVAIDAHGDLSASYAYPNHGDMPHVGLGNASLLRDPSIIRERFRKAVDQRLAH
jgi:hypothetical protein